MKAQQASPERGSNPLWQENVPETVMENAAAHLAYLDSDFNYVRVNSAYARGLGSDAEELIGRNHFELFPRSEVRPILEQARDSGEPAEFSAMPIVLSTQTGRGTTYWDWSLVPVKGEKGEVQGLVITSMEVTERVRLRKERERLQEELERHAGRLEEMVDRRAQALRASEARFRAIFEDSVLGIAILDGEGRVVVSNQALTTVLERDQELLQGARLHDFGHPEDAELDQDLYQTLVSGELSYYQVEKRFVSKDGQVRWGELTVSRVKRTRKGEPRLAIAMIADITEKKASQEALLRAERLAVAGRLGASLAHEINNPLQAVIGCLGLAEEILEDGVEVRGYLQMAMEELERAAGIVAQLRDLSRTSEVTKREPTDLNAIVERSLLLTRRRTQDRGIEVVWSPAPDLPQVPAAPDRLQQVFLNLVMNAIDAMPRGGQLRVSASPTEQPLGVHVRVADTGAGIEPDSRHQLFEPFHTTRPEGLGLGLYVSKNIVEEHHGYLELESRVGRGTTFTVWLPA